MDAADADLLRRYAADRDEAAFAELVRRYLNLVYFAALRQVGGDAHRAEDVTQNVFALLARKAPTLTHHQSLAGWLHTTTRYAASEAMRAERRRLAREQEAHTMHELTTDSAADHAWARLRPAIDDVLGELSEPDREAVLLRFFANRPLAEIGAKLHVSENAARMRIDRALEKLHALLAKRGVTSTAVALGTVLASQAAASAPTGLAASVTGAVLASAAAAGSGAGWLVFMSMTKVQMAAAVIAALAMAAAFYEAEVARSSRAAQADIGQRLVSVAQRTAVVEQSLRAAVDESSRLAQVAAITPPRPAAGASSSTTSINATVSQAEILVAQARARRDLERTHPDYQRVIREIGRRELVRQYGPLYAALGLAPGKVAEFERVMAEYDWMRMDIESAARANGFGDVDPAVRKLLADVEQKRGETVKALLGAGGDQRFEAYFFSESVKCEFTDWLAGALYLTPTPLTGTQATALTEILARHTTKNEEGRADPAAVDWAAMLPEAQRVLAPAQLPFLESLQKQQAWKKVFNAAVKAAWDKPASAKPPGE